VCRHQSSATATGLTADQKTLLRIITGQQQQPHTSRCVLTMLGYQWLGLLYQGGHKPGSGYCPKMKVKEKTKRCNVIDVIFLCSFTHLVTPPKPCSTMKVVTLSSVHPLYRCTSRCVLAMLGSYWGSAWQGGHRPGKPGILGDFSEHGKLREFCATSGKNCSKQNNFNSSFTHRCKTAVDWVNRIITIMMKVIITFTCDNPWKS